MSIFTSTEAEFEEIWAGIKHIFVDDVEPTLKLFFKQFAGQFGKQALDLALADVGKLATGESFAVVAIDAATTLYADAKADAKEDGALDAATILQTVQSAFAVAKVATATVAPSDTAAIPTIASAPAVGA